MKGAENPVHFNPSLMLAGNEFQSLGRAIVKEDGHEEVRWDGIVSIVSWRERVFRLWWEESLSQPIVSRDGKRAKTAQLLQRGEQKQVGKSGCGVGKRTVPVRKHDSILKALSSLENANIFLERTILSNSVLLTICGLGSVWSWNFLSRRGGSEVHSKTQSYGSPALGSKVSDRWIGRGGPIAWPPRSPDLNPLDFYLWGHLKSLVYSSPVPDLQSLRNRIVARSEDIRNTPGVRDRVRRGKPREKPNEFQVGIEPTPERNSGSAGKRLIQLSYAGDHPSSHHYNHHHHHLGKNFKGKNSGKAQPGNQFKRESNPRLSVTPDQQASASAD
ncbi:hypothetical protein ANN_16376 [Periplaneta americana]|uniref:Uncharacterized protein n=1 Tax=Periplaneta americana TaxID=6978 RepID=A0ABQ8SK11_PERAM|nr:hypothetical protein ANN_16376 [Periplaneta americana]